MFSSIKQTNKKENVLCRLPVSRSTVEWAVALGDSGQDVDPVSAALEVERGQGLEEEDRDRGSDSDLACISYRSL